MCRWAPGALARTDQERIARVAKIECWMSLKYWPLNHVSKDLAQAPAPCSFEPHPLATTSSGSSSTASSTASTLEPASQTAMIISLAQRVYPGAARLHNFSLARRLTTAPATGQTVALSFDHYAPASLKGPVRKAGVGAVVLAHGLFGSKQNWRSVARDMAKRFAVPIYAVDLRNHGASPAIDGMNFADMASDLVQFIEEQSLENTLLVGHSMGGKAALATALSPRLPAHSLAGVVSVDMAPSRGTLSGDFIVRALVIAIISPRSLTTVAGSGLFERHDCHPRRQSRDSQASR